MGKLKSAHKFFLVLLLILGVASQSLTMVRSGLLYPFGMGFWGPNAHDGLWHIALVNQLAQGSLAFPTFAGSQISNYHLGFDLLTAVLHRLTGLSPILLYFQILPVIFSLSYGILVYLLANKIFKNQTAALFSLIFAYFGGSFGWLVNLFRGEAIGGESMFWSMQAVSFLINPPFILSVILLLSGLIFYLNYLESGKKRFLFFSVLIFGILIQVKVYAGIIVLGALLLTSVTEFLSRRSAKTFFVFLLSFLVALAVFLPLNRGSQTVLVYKPWWFLETMFSFPDRLGLPRMDLIRQVSLLTHNYLKLSFWLTSGLVIFLVGNLGTRVIGFLSLLNLKKENFHPSLKLFSLYALLIAFALPMLFIQKGTNWNTIQFFYYFLVLMSFWAGRAVEKIWAKRNPWQSALVILILVLMTLPTTISSLANNYLPSRPPVRISKLELEGLKFLKNQPEGIVLTFPFNPALVNNFVEPRPIYTSVSTAYVSALTDQISFLEDEMNLEITNKDYFSRLKEVKFFFDTNNKPWARGFLIQNKIRYIYLERYQDMRFNEAELEATRVYENGEIRIFRVSW